MSQNPFFRDVTLANGDSVTLHTAANRVGLLESYLHSHECEWDPVPLMRELAFDRKILPQQIGMLQREKLVDANGQLDPVMRSVILSSVRGTANAIHIDSPFTEPGDRALAELLHAQDHVRVEYPKAADALLMWNPVGRGLDFRAGSNPPPEKWTDREEDRDGPSGPPPLPR